MKLFTQDQHYDEKGKQHYLSRGSLSQYLCIKLMLEFTVTDAPVESTTYGSTSFVLQAFNRESLESVL